MGNRKILIAEDYLDNFLLIKAQLKGFPYTLIHVKNGEEALDIIQKEEFDLLLIDIQMPIINGLELIKIIRKDNNQIPAIAQTAYAYEIDHKECLEAGFNDYISKPINKNILLEMLQNYLN